MEGTNHIERRDKHSRPMTPKFDLSKCVVESDYTSTIYRENFLGRVSGLAMLIIGSCNCGQLLSSWN